MSDRKSITDLAWALCAANRDDEIRAALADLRAADEHTADLQKERAWLRLVAAAYSTEAINVTGNLDPKAAVVFVRDHETPLETRIDERGILVRTDALEAALRAAIGESDA